MKFGRINAMVLLPPTLRGETGRRQHFLALEFAAKAEVETRRRLGPVNKVGCGRLKLEIDGSSFVDLC